MKTKLKFNIKNIESGKKINKPINKFFSRSTCLWK